MEKDYNISIDIHIEDSLRSTGILFPETDEQMSIYEETITLKELPLKFQKPTFVFERSKQTIKVRNCSDVDRTILAGHIINMCNTEDFRRVKFQKLLYLVEHTFQLNMNSDYLRKAAGPYDGSMIKQIEQKLQQYNFYRIPQEQTDNRRVYYIPLSYSESLDDLFKQNFRHEYEKIDAFLNVFRQLSWDQCEIIATLYAVWNNRIIKGQLITDELLKADFLAWDSNKQRYEHRILKALQWMKQNKVIPIGWGKEIE
jgi:type I restriction enzyme S subunit